MLNMSAENMVTFKTAFQGYSKSDVNEYIERLNSQFASLEEDYKKIILSQKEQINSYNSGGGELAKYKEENGNLKNKIEELKNIIANEANKNENENLSANVNAEMEIENKKLKDQIEELTSQIKSAEEYKGKSVMYDDMSSKVGNVLMIANKQSEEIIEDAKFKANVINRDALEKADALKRNAMALVSKMISLTNANMKNTAGEYSKSLLKYAGEVQSNLNSIVAAQSDKANMFFVDVSKKLDEAVENPPKNEQV